MFARAGRQYGDETLFTVRADGSDDQRIGGFLADKTTCCARWSPDGEDILIPVLAPDGRITTGMIAPDGSNLRTLPLPEGEPSVGCGIWSVPAGRMVCEGMDGLYTARIPSGDDLERVLDEHVIPVDVSPDGKQIVYIGPPVGGPTGVDPDAPVGSLFVVNMDGTNARRITPDGIYATSSGRWSPDGEWIVFGGLARPGDPLWVVRPDGSDFQEVFKDAEGRGAGCAVWSPDGEFIMFCLAESGPATLSVAPPNGLYVVRADGSDLTPIVTTPDFKRDIDWTYGGD